MGERPDTAPVSPQGPLDRGTRLDSWKEIAAYLNRDLRTLQRWEKTANGTVSGSHSWTSLGNVTVQVTVTDDDTGAASREATIAVTDATGAVCALGQLVTPLLSDAALPLQTRSELTQLLGQIQGNIDGQGRPAPARRGPRRSCPWRTFTLAVCHSPAASRCEQREG